MSSYHNGFNDGPNDKPSEPKPIRTDHSTMTEVVRDIAKRVNPTDRKVKKAMKDAGVD